MFKKLIYIFLIVFIFAIFNKVFSYTLKVNEGYKYKFFKSHRKNNLKRVNKKIEEKKANGEFNKKEQENFDLQEDENQKNIDNISNKNNNDNVIKLTKDKLKKNNSVDNKTNQVQNNKTKKQSFNYNLIFIIIGIIVVLGIALIIYLKKREYDEEEF